MGPPRWTLESTEEGEEICPHCRGSYSQIAIHWAACEPPRLYNHQMELVKGLLCGDGSIEQRRASFRVEMINKRFLKWLDNELGWLSLGVRLARTNDEVATHLRESFDRETTPGDAHDTWYLRTRTHPQFETFASWFDDGSVMRLPSTISLTRLELKMWYVSDGGLIRRGEGCPAPSISSHKESKSPNRVQQVFDQHGFDVADGPNFYIRGGPSEYRRFLEYLGEPPDGFEYKWAIDDVDRYYELKDEVGTQSVT